MHKISTMPNLRCSKHSVDPVVFGVPFSCARTSAGRKNYGRLEPEKKEVQKKTPPKENTSNVDLISLCSSAIVTLFLCQRVVIVIPHLDRPIDITKQKLIVRTPHRALPINLPMPATPNVPLVFVKTASTL